MPEMTELTAIKRAAFLLKLGKSGNVSSACKSAKISRQTVYLYRETDADFATEWDESLRQYVEVLETEADRRAVKGTVRDIYYQGKQVGKERLYSDTLLMFRLKKLDPNGYRERIQQQVTGDEGGAIQVNVTHNVVRRGDV